MDTCSLISGTPFYLVGLISGTVAGALVGYIQGHHDSDSGFARIRGLNKPTKKQRKLRTLTVKDFPPGVPVTVERNQVVDLRDYCDEGEGLGWTDCSNCGGTIRSDLD
jgi:hypothetical protein